MFQINECFTIYPCQLGIGLGIAITIAIIIILTVIATSIHKCKKCYNLKKKSLDVDLESVKSVEKESQKPAPLWITLNGDLDKSELSTTNKAHAEDENVFKKPMNIQKRPENILDHIQLETKRNILLNRRASMISFESNMDQNSKFGSFRRKSNFFDQVGVNISQNFA